MATNSFSNGRLSIAICDRCGLKHKYTALKADGARPGLRVCPRCYDLNHPIKTFKPKTDNFALRYPRPDSRLTVDYLAVREYVRPIELGRPTNKEDALLTPVASEEVITTTGIRQTTDLNDYIPPSVLDRFKKTKS